MRESPGAGTRAQRGEEEEGQPGAQTDTLPGRPHSGLIRRGSTGSLTTNSAASAALTFSSSDNCSSRSAIFLLATNRGGGGGGSGHLTSPFPCGPPRRAPPPREGPAAQAAAHAPREPRLLLAGTWDLHAATRVRGTLEGLGWGRRSN